jgi:hypothetical protein
MLTEGKWLGRSIPKESDTAAQVFSTDIRGVPADHH